MIKVSYNIKDWANDGTFYHQTIKVDKIEFDKIKKVLQRERAKAQRQKKQSIKKIACWSSEIQNKICYLKTLAKTEHKKQNNKVIYYLNLTQLATIQSLYNNKRIKTQNTMLICEV